MNDLTVSESYVYDSDSGTTGLGSPHDRSLGPDTPLIRSIVSRLDGLPRLPYQLSEKEISEIERNYNVDFSTIVAGRPLPFHRQPETRLAHSTPRPSFSGKLPIKEPFSPLDRVYSRDTRAIRSQITDSKIHPDIDEVKTEPRDDKHSNVPAIGGQRSLPQTTAATRSSNSDPDPVGMTSDYRTLHQTDEIIPSMMGRTDDKQANARAISQPVSNGKIHKYETTMDSCQLQSRLHSSNLHMLPEPATSNSRGKSSLHQNHGGNNTEFTQKLDDTLIFEDMNDSDKENHQYNNAENKKSPPQFINGLGKTFPHKDSVAKTGEKGPVWIHHPNASGRISRDDPIDKPITQDISSMPTDGDAQFCGEIVTGDEGSHNDANLDQRITENNDLGMKMDLMHEEIQSLRRENQGLRAKIGGLEAEIGERSQMMNHDENSEWADAYLKMHLDSLDSYTKVDAVNTLKKILLTLNIGTADNIPTTMKLWGRVIFHTSRFLDRLHGAIHPFEKVNPSDYTTDPESPENLSRYVQCLDNMITEISCYRAVQIKLSPVPADNKI